MRVLVIKGKTLVNGAVTVLFVVCAVLLGVWLSGMTADTGTPTAAGVPVSPIYRVDTDERKLALILECCTTDDTELSYMLDLLDNAGVKASFFFTGEFAAQFQDDVALVQSHGHEVYQMTDCEDTMEGLDRDAAVTRIRTGEKQVSAAAPLTGKVLALPKGWFSSEVLEAAHSLGYTPIRYTVSLQSIYSQNSAVFSENLSPYIVNGAIIRHGTDVPTPTVTLNEVLSNIKDRGYEIVPLGQLLYEDGRVDAEGVQHKG